MLKWNEPPALSSAEFLEQAQAHLSAADYAELVAVSLLPSEAPVSRASRFWSNLDTYIRNALVRTQPAAGSADKAQWLRHEADVYPGMKAQLDEAMAAPDPLQRERLLDELRWDALDEALVGHEFGFATLVVYRLRLLLAEKWAAMTAEQGLRLLKELADRNDRQDG
jgi:hypothetical protein